MESKNGEIITEEVSLLVSMFEEDS